LKKQADIFEEDRWDVPDFYKGAERGLLAAEQ